MRNARSRVERLESEAGASEPIRIYWAHLGEVAPPDAVRVTFTLDRPTWKGDRTNAEDEQPAEAA